MAYSNIQAQTYGPYTVLSVFLAMNLCTLFFTVFPVVATLPVIYGDNWYNGDDIFRLVEPIINLPLTFCVLWISPLCQSPGDKSWVIPIYPIVLYIYDLLNC